MKRIPLGRSGLVALVDDGDHARVAAFRWFPMRQGALTYARRRDVVAGRRVTTLLHRFILDAPRHLHVDHVNGDPLDNRRANLRAVTARENYWNRGPRHGTSKYVGVHWHYRLQVWVAQIHVAGKTLHIGHFDDEEEAARVRDDAARFHFGEQARLNFPRQAVGS